MQILLQNTKPEAEDNAENIAAAFFSHGGLVFMLAKNA